MLQNYTTYNRFFGLVKQIEADPEGLEQLRFLDAGWPIEMIEVAAPRQGIWEVNNPQDVALVAQRLAD